MLRITDREIKNAIFIEMTSKKLKPRYKIYGTQKRSMKPLENQEQKYLNRDNNYFDNFWKTIPVS